MWCRILGSQVVRSNNQNIINGAIASRKCKFEILGVHSNDAMKSSRNHKLVVGAEHLTYKKIQEQANLLCE